MSFPEIDSIKLKTHETSGEIDWNQLALNRYSKPTNDLGSGMSKDVEEGVGGQDIALS